MQQLLEQLGIDWHLLLSQAVNFLLLLIILRIFVYKPLLKLLHDRRARIEEGLTKADEADKRLGEIDEIGKGRIKVAEAEAFMIIKRTESQARAVEEKMLAEAKRKEREQLANATRMLRAKEEESRKRVEKEAAIMVRRAIVKTVGMAPDEIDEALIARAVKDAKRGV
jgi:F-type H+-transporting ATPase subunit b